MLEVSEKVNQIIVISDRLLQSREPLTYRQTRFVLKLVPPVNVVHIFLYDHASQRMSSTTTEKLIPLSPQRRWAQWRFQHPNETRSILPWLVILDSRSSWPPHSSVGFRGFEIICAAFCRRIHAASASDVTKLAEGAWQIHVPVPFEAIFFFSVFHPSVFYHLSLSRSWLFSVFFLFICFIKNTDPLAALVGKPQIALWPRRYHWPPFSYQSHAA